MKVPEKIYHLRMNHNLTQVQLGRIACVSDKAVSTWENGTKEPRMGAIQKICAHFGLDINRFIDESTNLHQCKLNNTTSTTNGTHGKDMLLLSEEATQIAKDYSKLDPSGKRIVKLVIADQQARMKENDHQPVHPINVIPLQRSLQSTSAGTGAYLGPEEMETIYVEENDLTSRASFCVPVSGNSMEPTYHDGDILLVEGRDDIPIGKIGIFTVDGEGYVKERGDRELLSLNPDYDTVPLTEDSRCNGLVIGILEPAWIAEE